MSDQERDIDRFRGRLGLVLTCKYAVALATAWAFLWGTVVLVLRASVGTPNELLLWGLAGVPVAVLVGSFLAIRRLPSPRAVRSLLDGHNHCGGLLMAADEVEVGQWREQTRVRDLPPVTWRGERAWGLLGIGAAFLLASFFVPQRFASANNETALDVSHRVKKLDQQVQVLKEEKVLDPARSTDLQKKLKQTQEEAKGTDPVKTLEALDRVDSVVQKEAKEAAESAIKKSEKLGKTESLADALRKKKKPQEGGLSDKQKAEAMQELARLTREAMKESAKLEKGIDPELLQKLQDGSLTPEQLEKLKDLLKDAQGDLQEMLEKLEKADLIDFDKLQECKNAGKCDGEGLLEYLKKCDGKCSVKDAMAKLRIPGRGGIDRGPAPAELTFGKESPESEEKLKLRLLPKTQLDQIKDSKVKGVSIGAPQIAKPGGETTSGALSTSSGGGGSAQTQIVLPRHRGTVERYFERSERK